MTIDRPDLRAQTRFKKALLTTVSAVVPGHAMTKKHGGEKLIQSYLEQYNCCPPPLFIIIVSLIEVCVSQSVYLSLCGSVHMSLCVLHTLCLCLCLCV